MIAGARLRIGGSAHTTGTASAAAAPKHRASVRRTRAIGTSSLTTPRQRAPG